MSLEIRATADYRTNAVALSADGLVLVQQSPETRSDFGVQTWVPRHLLVISVSLMQFGVGQAMATLRQIGLILCAVSALSACGERPRPADAGAVTLVFKHSKLFGDPAALDRLIAQFEKENPGVRVKRETLPSSSDEQHQFYATNLQAKSADFDVFALDVIWVAEFARAGWLRDLSALIAPESREEFFPGPIAAVTYGKRIYALPWFIDAGLLYYRKDLLDKYRFAAPETWEDLVRIAQAVTAKERELYGFVWQGKQYEGLVCNTLELLWSNGGEVMEGGRARLDTPANREALAFQRALIAKYKITPELVTTATEEPSREIFGKGRAVFLRNWPYAWRLFQREGSPVRGKVGITVLPHFPGHESVATLGGWQLGVNRYSRHPEAAERLVQFLASADAEKTIAIAYGYSPPRRSLYRDPELIAAQPFLADLHNVFEHARPRPVTPYYVMISQVLQADFSAAVAGIKSPEAALASAQQTVEDILRR